MKGTTLAGLWLSAAALIATNAYAGDEWRASFVESTYGVAGSEPLGARLNLRLGVSSLRYDLDAAREPADLAGYIPSEDPRAVSVLADWHPFGSSFRFTAGVLNDIETDDSLDAVTRDVVPDASALTSYFELESSAPYLGIGWGGAIGASETLGFKMDLGVLMDDISFDDDTDGASARAGSQVEDVNYLKDYEYLPVFSMGFSYKF